MALPRRARSNYRPRASSDRLEPVDVRLTSHASSDLQVYANLEVRDAGHWMSWPFRLEDGAYGGISSAVALRPAETKEWSFDIRKINVPPLPDGATGHLARRLVFRFRVVALDGAGNRFAELYSAPFVVRNPYGP